MSRIFHPLLYMPACATRQVQCLKQENRILRAKLPKRLTVTPAERRRLVRFGKKLGAGIQELITIVSPATFRKWVNGEGKQQAKKPVKKVGRPRTPQEIRDLVVRIGTETGWGYTRILGELKNWGCARSHGRR